MEIRFTKQALKDLQKVKKVPLIHQRVVKLLSLIENNPFQNPPSYEKLLFAKNLYSRRINIQHRLVYEVREKEKLVVIIRMWTHYE